MARRGKARLVVGLVGTAEALGSGLVELRARGLKSAQISLIARDEALLAALESTLGGASQTEAERGYASSIVCRPVDGADRWTVAAARPADGQAASATAEEDARALLALDVRPLQRQAQQVRRHLEAGGALVLVEPGDDAEERAACTALLRYASGGVQTHEITRSQET
jgi:hypothetical protein